ncbi:hypothetical protein NX059_001649 [Plenodomus lindquistii]|nr:hypothetical protein NX059_001649 [Plenodomus lindquistii]
MPVYRDPIWIEILFDNFLTWLTELFSALFRGTVFEWWLLDPQGQAYTHLFTIILAIAIWYFALDGTLWHTLRTLRVKPADVDTVDQAADNLDSMGKTPIMRKLAPPGHQPTNANLNLSPSRKRNRLQSVDDPVGRLYQMPFTTPISTDSGSDIPRSGFSDERSNQHGAKAVHFTSAQENIPDRGRSPRRRSRLGDRTGCPSNPGYQTPFRSRHNVDSFSESSDLPKLSAGGISNHEHGMRIESLHSDGATNSSRFPASQSSPGFSAFMSEIDKLKAHVDNAIADYDEAINTTENTDLSSTAVIQLPGTSKKTLREHYYPESVEHPDKFPSSSHFPVPSDEEWGDDLVDF